MFLLAVMLVGRQSIYNMAHTVESKAVVGTRSRMEGSFETERDVIRNLPYRPKPAG